MASRSRTTSWRPTYAIRGSASPRTSNAGTCSGGGANAGVSARLRRDQQVGRLFLGASRFFGAPLRSTVFLERSRQEINSEGAAPIVATVTDLSAEQSYSIRRRVELRYGYAFGRNRTVIEGDGTSTCRCASPD